MKERKRFLPILITSLLAAPAFTDSEAIPEGGTYIVEEVIDGSTLKFTNGEEVRLIGIDTSKMGRETVEFVKGLDLEGKEVRLEFDVQERDRYGRLLVYVYTSVHPKMVNAIVVADESCRTLDTKIFMKAYKNCEANLNATIIRSGYATPKNNPPNVKYANLFKELYEEAREQKRGLWADFTEGISSDEAMKSATDFL
jgi:micrococcal nuclease